MTLLLHFGSNKRRLAASISLASSIDTVLFRNDEQCVSRCVMGLTCNDYGITNIHIFNNKQQNELTFSVRVPGDLFLLG